MATCKSTQAAPAAPVKNVSEGVSSNDPAIESLLSEIASTAYFTDRRIRKTPVDDDVDTLDMRVDELRLVVARLGWMADIALQRLGSINTMYNGQAEQWLLTPECCKALLSTGAQS